MCSTRDDELSLKGTSVAFDAREALGKEAMMILLTAAGVEVEEMDDVVCRPAIHRILKRCAGLPVTLYICGTGVKRMRTAWVGDWREIWDGMSTGSN